jgi:hypothetical protein
MAGAITEETKKEGQRNAKRHTTHKNKKKKERVNPSCCRKLFHTQPFYCCQHANHEI